MRKTNWRFLLRTYPWRIIIRVTFFVSSAPPKNSSLFDFDNDDDDDAALFFGGSETKSRASSKGSVHSFEKSSKEGRGESIIVKDPSPSNVAKTQPPPLLFDDDDDDDLDWLQ